MPGGHSGRPLGPCLGRYESQTSHCRGQSSALFYGHILGCDLGRLHLVFLGLRWYYKTPITDLEIWTFGIDICDLVIYCRYMLLITTFPNFFGLFLVTICITWVESLGSLGRIS